MKKRKEKNTCVLKEMVNNKEYMKTIGEDFPPTLQK